MMTVELIPRSGTATALLDAIQNRIIETKAQDSVRISATLESVTPEDRVRFDLSPEVTKVVITTLGGGGLAALLAFLRSAFHGDRQFKTVCGICGSPIEVSLARGTEKQFEKLVRQALEVHAGCGATESGD